ncbi:hypothetical protein E3N88_42909 [Mikania micrantha]|uniref:CCHC-type domain-containing protein n=1 Tax=Mikania micrantha TaxID=192012 RepID=A0A5N6LHA1_9ASTR|nr:hypothetical protein E3N88_42909 [Mikania micrantha]
MAVPANQVGTAREHTTLSLQCPILTGSNYTIWAVKIKAIFKVHGVWEAIDPGVDIDQKKNSLAIAYLYQAIPEELVLQVAHFDQAKQVWDALKARFVGADRVQQARLGLLQTEFEGLKMKEGETVEEFAGRIGEIVSKTNSLGGEIEEKKLVRKFLGAVPERFLPIVASIEQFADLDTMLFQEVIGRLRAYEERIKPSLNNQGSKNDQQLLLSYEEWQAKKRDQKGSGRGRGRSAGRGRGRGRGSSNSRGRGHDQDQNQSRGKDRSQVKCFKCDKLGHFALNCPTRHEAANLVQDEGPALLMTVHSESKREVVFLNEEKVIPQNYNLNPDEDQTWFLDNGASNHMTGNRNLFSKLDYNTIGRVRFGDGSRVDIEGKGLIVVSCKNGEQRVIEDVYYIPSLRSNILSLGQFTELGYSILMKDEYLWMHEKDGRLLMKVHRSMNRLYKIELKIANPICLLSNISDEAWLWHARLGHLNFDSIKLLAAKEMALGVPNFQHPKQVCDSCLLGKQARLPFPTVTNFRAKKLLELIYADVCGPVSPTTQGGNRYMLLFVDDYSRFMWAYLIKSKDEVLGCFKNFKSQIELEVGSRIKGLRTDNVQRSARTLLRASMLPPAAAVVAGPPNRKDCAGAAISPVILAVLPQNPNPSLAKKGEVSRVGKQLPTLID